MKFWMKQFPAILYVYYCGGLVGHNSLIAHHRRLTDETSLLRWVLQIFVMSMYACMRVLFWGKKMILWSAQYHVELKMSPNYVLKHKKKDTSVCCFIMQ